MPEKIIEGSVLEEHFHQLETWTPGDILYFGPNNRAITLFGDVTKESTLAITSQLLELDSREPGEPITFYINTEGGLLADAFCVYDVALSIESPIITIAMGVCASAGLLLLSVGDLRLSYPNTIFFYHQAIMPGETFVSRENAMSATKAYVLNQEMYDTAILRRTKIKKSTWKKQFDGCTSKYFTAEEAQELQFINGIIGVRKKVKLKIPKEL